MDTNSTVETLTPYANQYFNNIFSLVVLFLIIGFYYYYKNKNVRVFVEEIVCPECESKDIEGVLDERKMEIEATCKQCQSRFTQTITQEKIKNTNTFLDQLRKDFLDFKNKILDLNYKGKK